MSTLVKKLIILVFGALLSGVVFADNVAATPAVKAEGKHHAKNHHEHAQHKAESAAPVVAQ